MKLLLMLLVVSAANTEDSLVLISKVRTANLSKYEAYIDAVIVHLEVLQDVSFAAMKFVAEEVRTFGCGVRDIDLYWKHNTLPVINPDGSNFPPEFKNITRESPIHMTLRSDKQAKYLNLTSPKPGCYFIAAFLPYTDPRYDSIQPPGLHPQCLTFVDVSLYVRKEKVELILDWTPYTINTTALYKIQAPEFATELVLTFDSVNVSDEIVMQVQNERIPTDSSYLESATITNSSNKIVKIPIKDMDWYYVLFNVTNNSSSLTFTIHFIFYEPSFINASIVEPPKIQVHSSPIVTNLVPFKQYDLVRESLSETFSYSYELAEKFSNSPTVILNITSVEYTVLKFRLRKHSDIGGLLQFILAYDPKLTEDKPKPKVVACLRPNMAEIPSWPDGCYDDRADVRTHSPLIINDTVTNATVQVPCPEYGLWYATFKLFCGTCEPCNCSSSCQTHFQGCATNCTSSNCSTECKNQLLELEDCKGCDCHGNCLRKSAGTCNTSVVFHLGADACANQCGKNGRCTFMVADGVVYATCVCSNNYRGWDCSDASLATPYYKVVIELLLLVLSNLFFLPTVYCAYRRKYYIEAVVYFSICFFSTFYHACDAGENIISFCITRLSALQFADFFCALLSIWVTLVAIADLPSFWPTMCHITGAIVLSFTTTINKTGFWGFLIPVCIGIVIIAGSWFLKWRKIRQRFLQKRYYHVWLPLGIVVVIVGIVIFIFLETAANYMYLHSLWHIVMAIAVIILLPRENTFHPETML